MKPSHTSMCTIGTASLPNHTLVPTTLRVNMAIFMFTLIQIGLVYSSPVTIRANNTFFKPTTNSNSQQKAQPIVDITTESILRSGDLGSSILQMNQVPTYPSERPMQPIGHPTTSIQQGNQILLQSQPQNNARIQSNFRPSSQNKELPTNVPQREPSNRDYASDPSSLNPADKFNLNAMYSPVDLVSEGSGNGPLDVNSRKPTKLDDTEEGEDDDDEDDYDDKDVLESNSDAHNLQKNPTITMPGNLHPSDWQNSPVDPYMPFRGSGYTSSASRPIFQGNLSTNRPTLQNPSSRPQMNFSDQFYDTINPTKKVNPQPSLPVTVTNSSTLPPSVSGPTTERPSDNRFELHIKSNQTTATIDNNSLKSDKQASFNPPLTNSTSLKNPANKTTSDSRSKDQDVDYDYNEDLEDDDTEDSSFEDSDPLDNNRQDNDNNSSNQTSNNSIPLIDGDDKQQQNFYNGSYPARLPPLLDNYPRPTFNTATQIPTSSPTTTPSSSFNSNNPPPYGSMPSGDSADYGDEDEEEDPEEDEDDLNIEEDDMDNEEDIDVNSDYQRNQTSNSVVATTPIVTTTKYPVTRFTTSATPVRPNLSLQQPESNQPNRINDEYSGLNHNQGFNLLDQSEQSKKLRAPVVATSTSSPSKVFTLKTTTSSPRIYPSTTSEPSSTSTTITSLLTLNPPTLGPTVPKSPSLPDWYTTSRPAEVMPPLGVTPNIVTQGTTSSEDDADLTRQIYDKAVELYQTVQKAVIATYDAVWQPNFDLSSSTFEPLLSQPLFFMCKYTKHVMW